MKLSEGIRNGIAASVAFGFSAFLALHFDTPPLHTKFLFVSFVCLVFGLALIPSAVINLFGGMRIDSSGVHIRSGVSKVSIPWDELKSWGFSGAQLRFVGEHVHRPQLICLSRISPENRIEVKDLLTACAPEKEQRIMERSLSNA